MWINIITNQEVQDNEQYISLDGTQYPGNYPKSEIPELQYVVDPSSLLPQAKLTKNSSINLWRTVANTSTFTFQDKQISCDSLSRSDIDAVAGTVSLTGEFPVGWPGAWKTADNSYIALTTVQDFKDMYAAMVAQGSLNFAHSQALKAALEAATTLEEVDAIVW